MANEFVKSCRSNSLGDRKVSKRCWKNWWSVWGKKRTQTLSKSCTKITSKCIMDLNVKTKTTQAWKKIWVKIFVILGWEPISVLAEFSGELSSTCPCTSSSPLIGEEPVARQGQHSCDEAILGGSHGIRWAFSKRCAPAGLDESKRPCCERRAGPGSWEWSPANKQRKNGDVSPTTARKWTLPMTGELEKDEP